MNCRSHTRHECALRHICLPCFSFSRWILEKVEYCFTRWTHANLTLVWHLLIDKPLACQMGRGLKCILIIHNRTQVITKWTKTIMGYTVRVSSDNTPSLSLSSLFLLLPESLLRMAKWYCHTVYAETSVLKTGGALLRNNGKQRHVSS